MALVIVILISIGIVAAIYSSYQRKQNAAIAENKAVDRNRDYFKQEHIFSADIADLRLIGDAMDADTLQEYSIQTAAQYGENRIVFYNRILGGSFTAALRDMGNGENGKKKYRFAVEHWSERNNAISFKDLLGANVLLTAIEKAIFHLDSSATVERRFIKHNIHTIFL